MIDAHTLKLFKDSEDRAHGTPKATIAGEPRNPVTIDAITIVGVKPGEVPEGWQPTGWPWADYTTLPSLTAHLGVFERRKGASTAR